MLAAVPDGPPVSFIWRRVRRHIARAVGPERIACEWWRDALEDPDPTGQIRDYFDVEDRDGRRYWLYRAGLYQGVEAPPRWFLHGLFQ